MIVEKKESSGGQPWLLKISGNFPNFQKVLESNQMSVGPPRTPHPMTGGHPPTGAVLKPTRAALEPESLRGPSLPRRPEAFGLRACREGRRPSPAEKAEGLRGPRPARRSTAFEAQSPVKRFSPIAAGFKQIYTDLSLISRRPRAWGRSPLLALIHEP